MIDIGIDPNLTLGPFSTTWPSFLTLIAVVVGTLIALRLTRAEWQVSYGEGPGDAHLYAVAAVCIATGLVGSRLFHVLDFWPVYAGDLFRILDISTGRSVMGAIVGGAVGAVLTLRMRGLPVASTLDRIALAAPFAMAVGRIGDVISGERWSVACLGVPWCVRYTAAASVSLGQNSPVQPVAGYELVADLAVGIALFTLARRRGIGDGAVACAFLVLYGAVRFFDTFLRLDAPAWGPLALAQWAALVFVLVGAAGLAPRLRARGRGRTERRGGRARAS